LVRSLSGVICAISLAASSGIPNGEDSRKKFP
jgi:hypothetical protein